MSNDSFKDFVEKQNLKADEVEIDWEQQLQEWKSDLNDFYALVEQFLEPYIATNKMSLERKSITIEEEYIGSYSVDAVLIRLGKLAIRLNPIGTNLIAAKGRVDMIGPSGTVRFILVPKDSSGLKINVRGWFLGEEPPPEEERVPVTEWSWKIATSPPHISYIELEAESFQSALMEVSNG